MYGVFEKAALGKFYRLNGHLFRENRFCVPKGTISKFAIKINTGICIKIKCNES